MSERRDSFRDLERASRRKTVELVIAFIATYCLIAAPLDLLFHTRLLVGFPVMTAGAALLASAQALRAYYQGSSLLMSAIGARELADDESVTSGVVADVVDEIALAAHIPRPRLCLLEDPAPNAFAAGRDPAHSVICVTRGLIDQLDREELQGVVAHEMAHIRGHDTRLAQMSAVMVGGFALVSNSILQSAAAQRRGDAATIPGFGLVALPMFLVSGLGWLFSKLTSILLSRQREFLADASAVEFTRNPTALIRALEHIARIESPLKESLRGAAPLFIVDPFECGSASRAEYLDAVSKIAAQPDKTKEQRDAEVAALIVTEMAKPDFFAFRSALSTHPPIRDRVARLSELLQPPAAVRTSEPDTARREAAKVVTDVTSTNPDAMAAVLQAMLRVKPGDQLMRALGADPRVDESAVDRTPEGGSAYADPADRTAYQKLYEYNLSLTGDTARAKAKAHESSSTQSQLESLRGGERPAPPQIDPSQLRAVLETAVASRLRKPASPNSLRLIPPLEQLHYVSWLLLGLSAGAIVAAFMFN